MGSPPLDYVLGRKTDFLSGPPSAHIFFGNIKEAFQVESGLLHRAWTKQFGPTFRYHLLFGETRICTSDPVSLNFILSHSDMLYKPALTRKILSDMLGSGVLVAEAADHRRQRRVLNPCFSLQSIKDVMPVFYDKAEELREKLLGLVEDDPLSIAAPTPTLEGDAVLGGRKIDVLKFLSLATIDIIGIAGFDYDFKALSQPENELAKAFSNMFLLGQSFDAAGLLQALIPGADRLVSDLRSNPDRPILIMGFQPADQSISRPSGTSSWVLRERQLSVSDG